MLNKIKLGLIALLLPLVAFGQSYPSPTFQNLTVLGTFTGAGNIGLPTLAAQAANTVVANATAASASPTAVAMPSCSATGNNLQWTAGTGFTCATGYALLASPTFTGTPLAPTATPGTNTTQIATTAFVQAAAGSGRLIGIQIFTSSGTYTPDTGTNSVIVEVQAAGGGAAGVVATTSTQAAAGSGAGAGAYAKVRYTSGFSGVSITIGAPGTAGGSGTAGGNAAATTFGPLISCPGGNAGGLGAAIAVVGGSAEPAAATAAPTISGGTTILSVAGAGTLPGQAIQTSGTQAIASSGASSMLGTGGTQTVVNTSAPVVGNGYGAGPSGGINTGTASAQSGLAGRPAVVIVWEFS